MLLSGCLVSYLVELLYSLLELSGAPGVWPHVCMENIRASVEILPCVLLRLVLSYIHTRLVFVRVVALLLGVFARSFFLVYQ